MLGGIVNLATKSGTNSYHGTLWEFFRNNALDANNYFNPKTDLKQNQFGASIGGPVVFPHYNGRNKTFFYGSYEGFRRRGSSSQLYVTPTPARSTGTSPGSAHRFTTLMVYSLTRTIRGHLSIARSCATAAAPSPHQCQRGAGGGHGLQQDSCQPDQSDHPLLC